MMRKSKHNGFWKEKKRESGKAFGLADEKNVYCYLMLPMKVRKDISIINEIICVYTPLLIVTQHDLSNEQVFD
jgi:hypothetical protein